MTRTPFDAFSKQLLEAFLAPFGTVELNREIAGESRYIDVWFSPIAPPDRSLGLLAQIAITPCLIEPYRNAPSFSEVRSCLLKLFLVHANQQRQARREAASFSEAELPHLWILSPTASEMSLNSFGAIRSLDWLPGIYALPAALRTSIVVIHQLPKTPDTLWLRLLGRGKTQQQAVEEILSLPNDDPRRLQTLNLLITWRITMRVEDLDEDDQISFMAINQAYLQWERETIERGKQEGRQEGRQEGTQMGQRLVVENLLKARFGEMDDRLTALIPTILTFSAEEYTPLLLQLSREQLLDRFQGQSEQTLMG